MVPPAGRVDTRAGTSAARPLRVLLAEDNPVNQRLCVLVLQRQGHEVSVVADGKEALFALERQPFDLALLDVQMPEMDGFEVTRVIRDRERASGRHVPIVALTARAMKGDRERCLAAGMDDYLAKPLNAPELRRVIARLSSRANAQGGAVIAEAPGDEVACPAPGAAADFTGAALPDLPDESVRVLE